MRSFLNDVLLPCAGFVAWAVWLLLFKRRQAPARSARIGPLWWAVATLVCAGATAYLLSGLGPGDGWGGLSLLVLGLCTGFMALNCLARCVFGLLQGVMGGEGGLPSQAEAARQRALLRANSPRPDKSPAKSPSQKPQPERPGQPPTHFLMHAERCPHGQFRQGARPRLVLPLDREEVRATR